MFESISVVVRLVGDVVEFDLCAQSLVEGDAELMSIVEYRRSVGRRSGVVDPSGVQFVRT